IHFFDAWPDEIFLRKGQNLAGVEAKLVPDGGGKLIEVTKDEFLQVIRGLITLDDPGFLEWYFAISPAARSDPTTHLAFGLALLNFGDDRFIGDAADHLSKSAQIARKVRDTKLEARAVEKTALAFELSYFDLLTRGDEAGAQFVLKRLRDLAGRGP